MGTSIDREAFDEVDDARFQQRLGQCLSTLGELLERPGFGVGPATLGAELELFLVDGAARPLQHNQAVRAAAADARVNVELDRFNLELNATPTLLAGCPFATLGEELRLLLGRVAEGARGPAGAGRHPAHAAPRRPGRPCHHRPAALPGAQPPPATAAP